MDLAERIQVLLLLSNAHAVTVLHIFLLFHCSEIGGTIGHKRPSPDYEDEDYDNDPFGHKKVLLALLNFRVFVFSPKKI